MNVFGETLQDLLEDRGLTLEELEQRANLDTGRLREESMGDWMDELIDLRLMPAVDRALDISEEEGIRLHFAYYSEERMPDHVVKQVVTHLGAPRLA